MPPNPFWINAASIEYKISPFLDLPAIKDGDWDLERRHDFKSTAKYRSIVQRFTEGWDWIETDLFTEAYARRLAKDGRIGRHRSLASLAEQYTHRIDGLYQRMRRDGFRTDNGNGKTYPLPALLVGRDGQVFIGNQGNHRLAIAQVLGLNQFAGRIACRHKLWTP